MCSAPTMGSSEPSKSQLDSAVFDEIYSELKLLARSKLRSQVRGATLQTTMLVHEVYLKLFAAGGERQITDRHHLMALCARAMRQVLVDHARTRGAKKRGSDAVHREAVEQFEPRAFAVEAQADTLLQIEQTLKRLEARDPRLGSLIELRFFGGYSVKETAEILGVSEPTVKRESRVARAVMVRELNAGRELST